MNVAVRWFVPTNVNRRQIARDLGLSYSSVRMVVNRYKQEGIRGIESGRLGRPAGSCRTLTPEQEEQMQRMICDKRPEQLKLDFVLWARAAVMLLIERECGKRIPVRSVGEYLKRWGFTPQKPIRRAYEQIPVAVQKWLDEAYPGIKQRARAKPEQRCSVEFCAGSPLPDGRVDLNSVLSGYTNSGSALSKRAPRFTGATKPSWSTQTYVAIAVRPGGETP
jgi:transposase